jgi:hypothetical protein
VRLSGIRKFPADCACQKQYEHNRRRYPKWAIKIGVAFQHVEEVCAGIQRRPAPLDHFSGVDIEELSVELDGPEKAFGGGVVAG